MTSGHGGEVILWSDYVTRAHGSINVDGGAQGGNGGFIETSSKNYLDVTGIKISARAPNGTNGIWLLDPSDLTISNAATADVDFGGDTFTADNGITSSNINVAELEAALAGASIIVQTTAGGAGAGSGNITVTDAITWATANSLTLNALNDIFINAAINGTNGGLVLNAGGINNSTTVSTTGSINTSTLSLGTGSLILGAAERIGNTTAVTVAANTTLNLNNFNETIGSLASAGAGIGALVLGSGRLTTGGNNTTTIFGGSITGTTGGITKEGTGIWQLASTAGVNSYSGSTLINAGSLLMRGSFVLPSTTAVTVAPGATLQVSGTTQSIGSLSGSGNITLGTFDFILGEFVPGNLITGSDNTSTTFSGLISEFAGSQSTVTKLGTGTFTLSGANSYTGLTTVNAGILSAAHASALGTAAGGTTVASGATLNINGVTIGGEAVTLNGGTLTGSGVSAWLGGDITLGGNSTITANDGTTFTLLGDIDGANALDLTGAGTLVLGGALGSTTPLASISASVGGLNMNGGTVTTAGNQTYNTPVTLGVDTAFAISPAGSGTIAFNNGILGNRALSLIGGGGVGTGPYSFSISGTLALTDITVTGNSLNNSTFSLNNSNPTVWTLTGSDDGTITGAAGVSGAFNFTGVNTINNTNGLNNTIVLENKTNTVQINSANNGFINNPIIFNGFQTFISLSGLDTAFFNVFALINVGAGTAIVNGVTMFFTNFANFVGGSTSTAVADVMQQVNPENNLHTGEPSWIAADVGQNVDDMLNEINQEYLDSLSEVTINPYCSFAG